MARENFFFFFWLEESRSMARETLDFIPSDVQSDTCEISKKKIGQITNYTF